MGAKIDVYHHKLGHLESVRKAKDSMFCIKGVSSFPLTLDIPDNFNSSPGTKELEDVEIKGWSRLRDNLILNFADENDGAFIMVEDRYKRDIAFVQKQMEAEMAMVKNNRELYNLRSRTIMREESSQLNQQSKEEEERVNANVAVAQLVDARTNFDDNWHVNIEFANSRVWRCKYHPSQTRHQWEKPEPHCGLCLAALKKVHLDQIMSKKDDGDQDDEDDDHQTRNLFKVNK